MASVLDTGAPNGAIQEEVCLEPPTNPLDSQNTPSEDKVLLLEKRFRASYVEMALISGETLDLGRMLTMSTTGFLQADHEFVTEFNKQLLRKPMHRASDVGDLLTIMASFIVLNKYVSAQLCISFLPKFKAVVESVLKKISSLHWTDWLAPELRLALYTASNKAIPVLRDVLFMFRAKHFKSKQCFDRAMELVDNHLQLVLEIF